MLNNRYVVLKRDGLVELIHWAIFVSWGLKPRGAKLGSADFRGALPGGRIGRYAGKRGGITY